MNRSLGACALLLVATATPSLVGTRAVIDPGDAAMVRTLVS